MITNLVDEFVTRDIRLDLVLIRADSEHIKSLNQNVNVIKLGAKHSLTSLTPLVRYLRKYRPSAMLVAKDRAGRVALMARKLAGVDTRIVIRLGTNLSTALEGKSSLARWSRYLPMRLIYPWVDKVVAVSEGVKQDTMRITGLTADKIDVIRNPVITPRMLEMAEAPVDHPWLNEHDRPVILGVGRMTRQKDFATLIKAFTRAHQQKPCRLIILGDGRMQEELEQLAQTLGVHEDLSFPGFAANPYAYMSKVDLFVLSSRWEGSPNVLTEAMALGTPVVSTNCPSGPNEILQEGRFGKLVAVEDDEALAGAITETLDSPMDSAALKEAVRDYTAALSANHYLDVLRAH